MAKALDLVGERWTLLLVRDLLLGPASYSSLLDGLPGLTTNLLAKRLKTLTEAGIIEAIHVDASATGGAIRGLYGLTKAGRGLAPIISGLGDWGLEHGPAPCYGDQINFRWLPVLLSRNYHQTGQRWLVQLGSGDKSIQLRLGTEEFESVDGSPMKPDLCIVADCTSLHALLFSSEAPDKLVESGRVRLEGTESDLKAAWSDFLDSFALRD